VNAGRGENPPLPVRGKRLGAQADGDDRLAGAPDEFGIQDDDVPDAEAGELRGQGHNHTPLGCG